MSKPRPGTWLTLLAVAILFDCSSESPGQATFRLTWPDGRPTVDERLFGFTEVAQGATVIANEGPVAYDSLSELELPVVPHGGALRLRFELRRAPWANARLAYLGVLGPVDFQAGNRRVYEVPVRRIEDPPSPEADGSAPRPRAESIVYVRQPWGSRETAGQPDYIVRGETGAATPGSRVLVYSEADVAVADVVAQVVVEPDGAFRAVLRAEAVGQPRTVYVGTAVDDLHSDSSTRAGLQAEVVRRSEWRATLRGKIAGSSFPNPHEARLVYDANEWLEAEERLYDEAPDDAYAAAVDPDGETMRAEGRLVWRRHAQPGRPPVRAQAASTVDRRNGHILMTGGRIDTRPISGGNYLARFDRHQWTEDSAPAPVSRAGATFEYLPRDEASFLFGGLAEGGFNQPAPSFRYSDDDGWTELAVPEELASLFGQATWLDESDGTLKLLGGCIDTSCERLRDQLWSFDGVAWTSVEMPATRPAARAFPAVVYSASQDAVFLFGGFVAGAEPIGDFWQFRDGRWRRLETATTPPARGFANFWEDPLTGDLLLSGGGLGSETGPEQDAELERLTRLWRYDGNDWQEADPARPRPQISFRTAVERLPGTNDVLHISGGGNEAFDEVWRFRNGRWRLLNPRSPGPGDRLLAETTFDAGRGGVLLFGGTEIELSQNNLKDDTWLLEGDLWTELRTSDAPPARSQHVLAHLASRGQTVVFGGEGEEGFLDDMWILSPPVDGSSPRWRQISRTEPWPLPRAGAAIAEDVVRQELVMFGGFNDDFTLGDTWVWDGDHWTDRTPLRSPEARSLHDMAYDRESERIVLAGGQDAAGIGVPSTWSWDGARWTSAGAGLARIGVAMASGARAGVLAFGGVPGPGPGGLTLRFPGSSGGWQAIPTPDLAPSPRAFHGLTFDPVSDRHIVVGGSLLQLEDRNRTWQFQSGAWSIVEGAEQPEGWLNSPMVANPEAEELLLLGGCDDSSLSLCSGQDLFSFNGYAWARKPSAPGLTFGAWARSPRGGAVLLPDGFLERDTAYVFDDGAWDAQTWNVPRIGRASSAYDAETRRLFLVGGVRTVPGRGFELSDRLYAIGANASSTPLGDGVDLPLRFGARAVWDDVRGRLFVAGGCPDLTSPACLFLEDVWSWGEEDGWRQEQPPPRAFGLTTLNELPLVYDSSRGQVVALASNPPWTLSEFDGDEWVQRPTFGPGPRRDAALAGARYLASERAVVAGDVQLELDASNNPNLRSSPDTYVLSLDPEQKPAVQLRFDVRTAGIDRTTVTGLRLEVTARGEGFDNPRVVRGAPAFGACVEVWDAWSGKWTELACATASEPELVAVAGTSDDPSRIRRWFTIRDTLEFRVVPLLGNGNGPRPASVELDDVELSIVYTSG